MNSKKPEFSPYADLVLATVVTKRKYIKKSDAPKSGVFYIVPFSNKTELIINAKGDVKGLDNYSCEKLWKEVVCPLLVTDVLKHNFGVLAPAIDKEKLRSLVSKYFHIYCSGTVYDKGHVVTTIPLCKTWKKKVAKAFNRKVSECEFSYFKGDIKNSIFDKNLAELQQLLGNRK